METTGAGSREVLVELGLSPVLGVEIEVPGIIKITDTLTSEHHQVWKLQLRNVVSAFPRSRLILLGLDFNPVLGGPV